LRPLTEAWKKLDPHATGFIPTSRLVPLLKHTGAPLGVRGRGLHSSTLQLNLSTFYGIRRVHDFPPVY